MRQMEMRRKLADYAEAGLPFIQYQCRGAYHHASQDDGFIDCACILGCALLGLSGSRTPCLQRDVNDLSQEIIGSDFNPNLSYYDGEVSPDDIKFGDIINGCIYLNDAMKLPIPQIIRILRSPREARLKDFQRWAGNLAGVSYPREIIREVAA